MILVCFMMIGINSENIYSDKLVMDVDTENKKILLIDKIVYQAIIPGFGAIIVF